MRNSKNLQNAKVKSGSQGSSGGFLLANLAIFPDDTQIAAKPCPGRWTAMPYTAQDVSGAILFTSNGTHEAPPVRIPLEVPPGRYAIHLGLFFGLGPSMFWMTNGHFTGASARMLLRARLERDSAWDVVSDEVYGPKSGPTAHKQVKDIHGILEVSWREVELRPSDILLLANLGHEAFAGTIASLAYIRLVPLKEVSPEPHRNLIANYDSTFWGGYPADESELRTMLEPLRDGDFRAVCWEMVKGDNCYYRTSVGRIPSAFDDTLYYPNLVPRDLRRLLERTDPLEALPRIAHEMGIQFFAAMRLIIGRGPYGFYTWPGDGGFCSERQFWIADEHGTLHPHLSLAYEPVRDHLLRYYEEMLSRYDIDGVSVMFNRSYPFVLFEPPVIEAFQKEFGEDARKVDPLDERLWRTRSFFITEYMRLLRKLADTAGDRRRSVIVTVMSSPRQSHFFGLDVGTWVREGLVDELIVHPCFFADPLDGTHITTEHVRQWKALTKGTDVTVRIDMYPRHLPPERIIERASEYYEAGADGLALWDVYSRMWRKSEWSALRRSGNPSLLRRWREDQPAFWSIVPVHSIMGLSVDRRYGIQTHG